MNPKKLYKVGVHQGGGPEPGYLWTVLIDEHSHVEAIELLDEDQYQHIAIQFKDLARSQNPRISDQIDIDQVEGFYEVRDKGGILGKLNVRVYFCVDDERRRIVCLSTWNKKKEGPTPDHIKTRVRRRMRIYNTLADEIIL